jgi:hypothetical protein
MAKKLTAAQDSIPKQTYFSTKGGSNVSNKSGGDYYIERMGKKPVAKKDTTSNPILNKINSIVGGKKKVAPSVKVDSTKKVTMGGNTKPSIMIKKQTTVKPSSKKPLLYEFDKMPSKMKKRMDNFNKSKKVEYKPLPKK